MPGPKITEHEVIIARRGRKVASHAHSLDTPACLLDLSTSCRLDAAARLLHTEQAGKLTELQPRPALTSASAAFEEPMKAKISTSPDSMQGLCRSELAMACDSHRSLGMSLEVSSASDFRSLGRLSRPRASSSPIKGRRNLFGQTAEVTIYSNVIL